ncbi:MAG: hypothetical protein V1889_02890 [archaeon]
MKKLKSLWEKGWFFIPVSFVLWWIVMMIVFAYILPVLFDFQAKVENVVKLMLLFWGGSILNRYWWNKKK